MSSLISVIKSFFGFSAELSKLEKAILGSVREKLKPREAEIWDKQLSAINKIHRSPDGRELNLYVMRRGKADFPKDICFENVGEFKIAVVDISANGGTIKLRGRVWCVGGHVFSIEYKNSFTEFLDSAKGDWQIHCHIENYPT